MAALTVPADEVKRLKGMGFLNNKGTDLFSARIVVPGGSVCADQAETLAQAARLFGSGHILFTTRLDVEIPGIPYEKIEDFHKYLSENGQGLETGSTGPRVRSVVCCKSTICQYGQLDSFGIAKEIHTRFYKGYQSVTLPHKFKIAVGGCPNSCIKPTLNDLGIVGWGKGYKIYLGGRWGKKKQAGQALETIITDKEEMLNIIEKCILLFKEQGADKERFADTISRIGFENVQSQVLSDELLERKKQILSD